MILKKSAIGIFGIMMIFFLIGLICAEKIDIQVGNNYYPGDNVKFVINLYDNDNNLIDGKINFTIQNYYADIIQSGIINSGEEVNFALPENAINGYWKITGEYKTTKAEMLFTVGELGKATIKLEGDTIIVTNTGNIPYSKQISIQIGDNHETALVSLDVGQIKKIRLTAPTGEYKVKVSDGTEENTFEVDGVGLTGNVIGLEKVMDGSFIKNYPLVSLFLISVLLVALVVFVLRFVKSRGSNVSININNKNTINSKKSIKMKKK
jgi:hypothetical protein